MQGESVFTFQYGQIYYKSITTFGVFGKMDLHSNMVRFIMILIQPIDTSLSTFTFQYGQIYYRSL